MLFVLNIVAGNSVRWFTAICYVVISKQFGSSMDVAVGVLTSFQGLSTKIHANIAGATHIAEYDRVHLMLNAVVPAVVSIFVLWIMKLAVQDTIASEEFKFWDLFLVKVTVFALITSFNNNLPYPSVNVCSVGGALLLGLLVVGWVRHVYLCNQTHPKMIMQSMYLCRTRNKCLRRKSWKSIRRRM